jgi:hypothetical protein
MILNHARILHPGIRRKNLIRAHDLGHRPATNMTIAAGRI